MNNRYYYNIAILGKLFKLVELYPDMRFGQLLVDCDIIKYEHSVLCNGEKEDILSIDPFDEEPEITYKRMLNKLNEF